MEDMMEFDNVLLDDSILRLPVQYDASGFLEACSPSQQYRILASICTNESCNTFRPHRQQEQHEGQEEEKCNGSARVDDSLDGVPVICYAARLLAFSTTSDEHTASLALLQYAREQHRAAEEMTEAKAKAKAEAELAAVEEQKEQENTQEAEEYYYDEEGGYYYDKYGYYDENGAYYLFETAETAEPTEGGDGKKNQNANEEPIPDGDEAMNPQMEIVWDEGALCTSGDFCTVDSHGEKAPDPAEDEIEKTNSSTAACLWRRRCPSVGEWTAAPFLGGICAVHRAAALLESSLPSADTFLRESGIEPGIPICAVETECEPSPSREDNHHNTEDCAVVGHGRPLEASGLHVLASRRHLHIVHVSGPRDESELSEAFLHGTAHTVSGGVLCSIPIPDESSLSPDSTTTPYQFTYESVGDGLFVLDVSAASVADSEARRVIVSLVFGIPSDANVLFRTSQMSQRLVECYERRVSDHLSQRTHPLRYSVSLLCRNARDTALASSIVYDAAAHAFFHKHEREDAARAAEALEEMFFFKNHMESPRRCALRKTAAALDASESTARETLCCDEASERSLLTHMSQCTLSLVAQSYAAAAAIMDAESRSADLLRAGHEEESRRIATAERVRRLNAQFAFEWRLHAVECAAAVDVLFEREAAGRARVERDEANEFRDAGLMERAVELRTQALVALHSCRYMCGAERNSASTMREAMGMLEVMPQQEQRVIQKMSRNSSMAPTTDEFMRVVSGRPNMERWGHGQSNNHKDNGRGSGRREDRNISSTGFRLQQRQQRLMTW